MKSKIVFTSTLFFLTFVFSSYQYVSQNVAYQTVTKNASEDRTNTVFIQESVSCAKCHDCQSNLSDVPETNEINIKPNFTIGNLNEATNATNKIMPVLIEEHLDWQDALNPDALKIK